MPDNVTIHEVPFESVMITPPRPGVCQICAVKHEAEFPHNLNSLYYQMKFRQEHGRAPTWRDAAGHCTEEMKRWFADEYAKRGLIIDIGIGEDGPAPE